MVLVHKHSQPIAFHLATQLSANLEQYYSQQMHRETGWLLTLAQTSDAFPINACSIIHVNDKGLAEEAIFHVVDDLIIGCKKNCQSTGWANSGMFPQIVLLRGSADIRKAGHILRHIFRALLCFDLFSSQPQSVRKHETWSLLCTVRLTGLMLLMEVKSYTK